MSLLHRCRSATAIRLGALALLALAAVGCTRKDAGTADEFVVGFS